MTHASIGRQLPLFLSTFVGLATACGPNTTAEGVPPAGGTSGTSGQAPIAGASGESGAAAASGAGAAPAGGSAGAPGEAGTAGTAGQAESALAGCDEGLKTIDLGPDAAVTLVRSFLPGDVLSLVEPTANDPVTPVELCLVKLVVGPGNPGPVEAPSTSVGIGIEVWLPTLANWNERYEALGNGGFAGGPEVTSLTAIGALRPGASALFDAGAGFVTSLNDGGHTTQSGAFAMQPDGSFNEVSFADFAERASHEMALKTKALIQAFYGKQPKYSYFIGCSEGGREALKEVQRYPADFDGVLAGAPAVDFARLNIADLWPQIVMQRDLGGPMAPAKLVTATTAANAACSRALTGQPDGYITDPTSCRYDPTTDPAVLCVSSGGTNGSEGCLSLVEATALNKIWYGPTLTGTAPTPATDNGRRPRGERAAGQLWYGLERGTRLTGHFIWDGLAGQMPSPIATDTVALALGDPALATPLFTNATGNGQNGWRDIGYTGSLSLASVLSAAETKLGDAIATDDADLSAFAALGGRLLIWHGTSDSLIPPQGSVHYYEAVSESAGGYAEAQKFARFYLAPGFDHCFGAGVPGTNPPAPGDAGDPGIGLTQALRAWVEEGVAPDQLIAKSEPGVTPLRVRPWCLYPKQLKYVGGDVDTGSFDCE